LDTDIFDYRKCIYNGIQLVANLPNNEDI
jgi:hypothetical protein